MNARQKRFVEEYLIDLNATQAAIRAGYSVKTAYSAGQRQLKKVEVKNAVDAALEKRRKANEVTAEKVIKELARIAFADPRKIFSWGPSGVTLLPSEDLTDDEAAAVAEVSQTITESGGSIKAKLHDKGKALELLGRHLGMFVDKSKVEVEAKINVFDDETRARLLEMARDE